jgi:hypothetical protein
MTVSRGIRPDRPRPLHRVLAALAIFALGCTSSDPWDEPRRELDTNRARWLADRPTGYEYTLERLCFCGPEARGPVAVSVVGADVTERVYVGSGEPVPADLEDLYPSVDGLFEFIDDAMERDAHRIQVTYDSATGVPLDAWVDYSENVADEELGFAVRSLPAGS